jgi:hypothetical protein
MSAPAAATATAPPPRAFGYRPKGAAARSAEEDAASPSVPGRRGSVQSQARLLSVYSQSGRALLRPSEVEELEREAAEEEAEPAEDDDSRISSGLKGGARISAVMLDDDDGGSSDHDGVGGGRAAADAPPQAATAVEPPATWLDAVSSAIDGRPSRASFAAAAPPPDEPPAGPGLAEALVDELELARREIERLARRVDEVAEEQARAATEREVRHCERAASAPRLRPPASPCKVPRCTAV